MAQSFAYSNDKLLLFFLFQETFILATCVHVCIYGCVCVRVCACILDLDFKVFLTVSLGQKPLETPWFFYLIKPGHRKVKKFGPFWFDQNCFHRVIFGAQNFCETDY